VREADDRDDRLRMLLVCGFELDGVEPSVQSGCVLTTML